MRDVYCLDSIKTGRYAVGAQLIGQRLYRALTTPRGQLLGGPEEESFGEDLTALLGGNGEDIERKLRARIQRAISKDETIQSASVEVSSTKSSNGSVSCVVSIEAKTASGPFNLVISVGAMSVELVGLS